MKDLWRRQLNAEQSAMSNPNNLGKQNIAANSRYEIGAIEYYYPGNAQPSGAA